MERKLNHPNKQAKGSVLWLSLPSCQMFEMSWTFQSNRDPSCPQPLFDIMGVEEALYCAQTTGRFETRKLVTILRQLKGDVSQVDT